MRTCQDLSFLLDLTCYCILLSKHAAHKTRHFAHKSWVSGDIIHHTTVEHTKKASFAIPSAKEYYYTRRIRIWGYWHEVCLHNAFDWIQTVRSILVWSKSCVLKKKNYNQQCSVQGQHNKCTLASSNTYRTSVNKHDVSCNETWKEEIPCRALYWNLLPE